MRLLSLVRPAAAALLVAVPLLAAPRASAAQTTVSAAFAPVCAGDPTCTLVRFSLVNTTGATQLFDALTLGSSGAPFVFAASGTGAASFEGEDSVSPLVGLGTVTAGTQFFVNFVDATSFQFELGAGATGFLDLALLSAAPITGAAFTFEADIDGLAPVRGAVTAVSTVPEPATIVLMGSGLAALASGTVLSRRRRQS